MHRHHRCDDSGTGCLALILMAVIAMPLVGLYIAIKGESDEEKLLGVALLIVGIIMYIAMGNG